MKTRILSGLIMLPLAVFLILGGYWLLGGCFALSVMALWEFYRGFRAMDVKPSLPIGISSCALLYLIGILHLDIKWYMLWFFVSMTTSLLYLFAIEKRKTEDAFATMAGIFYIVFFFYHITLTDQTGGYHLMVWLIILTAFGTDITAYFSGVFIGRHKLCPKISPKKTIEGSIGGIVGSVILCGAFGAIFIRSIFIHCMIIGALGGVISQFGDLTASIFKRKMGIKDYGNLIPGHGGVLDRFDSVLFTAPMVFYYIIFIIGA